MYNINYNYITIIPWGAAALVPNNSLRLYLFIYIYIGSRENYIISRKCLINFIFARYNDDKCQGPVTIS